MNKVTLKNYIPNYLLNPLSKEINKVDRAICLIASIILGVFTAGLLHLLVAGYQWLVSRAENQTHNPTETNQRVNNSAFPTVTQTSTPTVDLGNSNINTTLEVEHPEIEPLEPLETTKTELKEAIEQIAKVQEHKQYAEILFVQVTTLSENTNQLLSDSVDEPELQQIIIDSTLHEFKELLSLAHGLLTFQKEDPEEASKIPDELYSSYLQREWVQNAEKIVRKAKHRYTQELGEEFRKLLAQGIGANTIDGLWIEGTILHSIAKWGKPIEFVAILDECGIDFNRQDLWENTALIWAIANGKNEMAWEILKYDQNLDIMGHGNSALHLAIVKGYKDCTKDGTLIEISNFQLIEKMLEQGANPNLANRLGYTSLHLACIRRDPDMIRVLIQEGADINIPSPDGKTCVELLETSFEDANAIMKMVTPPYLLPEEEFYENQATCLYYFN